MPFYFSKLVNSIGYECSKGKKHVVCEIGR